MAFLDEIFNFFLQNVGEGTIYHAVSTSIGDAAVPTAPRRGTENELNRGIEAQFLRVAMSQADPQLDALRVLMQKAKEKRAELRKASEKANEVTQHAMPSKQDRKHILGVI